VENTAKERSDARGRDVDVRLSEMKDIQGQLRSEILRQQEHIEQFKGFQVDKVTEELRRVVQDLASTSDMQGGKIKELERMLEAAREAKSEVHRLKNDLEAEVSTRALKDTELQGRLEREVHEFSRRVERLTTATSELGGDLQKSRSNTMYHSMRSGRLSVASIGSASPLPERTRITVASSRLETVSQEPYSADS